VFDAALPGKSRPLKPAPTPRIKPAGSIASSPTSPDKQTNTPPATIVPNRIGTQLFFRTAHQPLRRRIRISAASDGDHNQARQFVSVSTQEFIKRPHLVSDGQLDHADDWTVSEGLDKHELAEVLVLRYQYPVLA
jgi:hypothetical protein